MMMRLYGFRLRLFALARELDNVRAACRAMGVHPSTYYRWRRQLVRFGPEINQIPPHGSWPSRSDIRALALTAGLPRIA